MRYIAAYLLLKIGGNESPSADDITKVIQSVGIEVDEDRLESLLSELNGKDINALIAEGIGKLASVPSGGAAVAAASGAGGAAPAAAAETQEEEKKEEKEESDEDMGFGLFD
ncbi:60S acidic ribosomal protein p2 [Russula compacta]|nr:60S acidic ribosomal protein p2 [Russula compacta]